MFQYEEFSKWVDEVLEQEMPGDTIAIAFNLYEEHEENTWAMQIAGTERFDEEDWACYETFSTGEELYRWVEEGGWEKALEIAIDNVNTYLNSGKMASALLQYQGVGIGFVDGDIEIIYKK